MVGGEDDGGFAIERGRVAQHVQDVANLGVHALEGGGVGAGGIGRPAERVAGGIRVLKVEEHEVERLGGHAGGEIGRQIRRRRSGGDFFEVDFIAAVVRAGDVRRAGGGAV